MTSPSMKALLRPMIEPILPPVTMSIAITSVYRTMALWIPVMVVPRSSATVAIETFMTELSSAIRNCPAHSVRSTTLAPFATALLASGVIRGTLACRRESPGGLLPLDRAGGLARHVVGDPVHAGDLADDAGRDLVQDLVRQ